MLYCGALRLRVSTDKSSSKPLRLSPEHPARRVISWSRCSEGQAKQRVGGACVQHSLTITGRKVQCGAKTSRSFWDLLAAFPCHNRYDSWPAWRQRSANTPLKIIVHHSLLPLSHLKQATRIVLWWIINLSAIRNSLVLSASGPVPSGA